MKKLLSFRRLLLCCGGFLFSLPTLRAASSAPALSVQSVSGQSVQLTWPSTAVGFDLEEAFALGNSISWQPVNRTPVLNGNQFTVSLAISSTAQFFRLRLPEFTTIEAISPVDGETGVAVTRETIVHFSGPLATNAVVKTNNFYALSAGRRILSRVEMSSDRTKATLFYLEPLPGSARVNVFFDGAGLNDALGRPIDPAGEGIPFGLKVFSFDTLSLTPLVNTAVVGTVYATELVPGNDTGTNAVNKPLAGVTITVDGMEQSLRAVTDTNGNFKLSPVPPGRFFAHIDGRTVVNAAAGIHYPDKAYYPFVGKAWDAVAGKTNNLAGGTGLIYLPLIKVGTLQPVSMTNDTVISFLPSVISSNPALAGVSITVPANSLFSDDGTRGGKVGIAPVPPNRLPGPLPPGLELPIVITVQTDGGLNFDKPAPICFPNLPDAILKTPLPAGSKQALISFNHDKGIWEAVGSMTVSADGKMICTDPGVGILQPGWHGVGPLPDGPPPCSELCCDGGGGGGGPFLLSSLAGRIGAAGGLIGKAGPTPSSCKKPCPFKKLAECMHKCALEFEQCRQFLMRAHVRCERAAVFGEPLECKEPGGNDRSPCKEYWDEVLRKCQHQQVVLGQLCQGDYRQCLDRCKDDCPGLLSVSGRIGKAGPAEDFILEQIRGKLDAAAALLAPYFASGASIPVDVREQFNALERDADAVAGGDALRFLDQYLAEGDEELAAMDAEFGEDPGNAPPYPVLFAAEIDRPGSTLTLRGETGPFGQYSLFVPRDGVLLYVSFYDSHTKRIGLAYPHLRPEAPHRMPRFNLRPMDETFLDSDHDGLPDAVEYVYGTNETNPDSDGDGILDGAEIDQGTNPLDGVPVRTGIVGTAKTPGAAVDLAAANDLLAVAEGTSGVSLVSVSNPMNPVLIGQVDTPGNAQAVAVSGNFVAVADGDQGLAIIDASDPSKAQIVHQVPLNGTAQGVALAGNIAYVGLQIPDNVTPGAIATVDLITGTILDWFSFGSGFLDSGDRFTGDHFHDLAVNGDELYVLTYLLLTVYRVGPAVAGHPEFLAQVRVGGPPFRFRRLFVGGGFAYVSHSQGYSVVDVRDPAKPKVVAEPPAGQFTMTDLALNGSGSLLGVTSVAGTQRLAVSLYDASQPTNVTKYLSTFLTPGDAQAVTIHQGLAFVADSTAGIQVLNYLPFDGGGKAPAITLSTSVTNGSVAAGSTVLVTANASDDVQVRNVEFYVDSVKTFTDGNFPFEYRFDTPPRTATKTNVVLRARTVDTGGNFTWSDEITILLNQDVTVPRVLVSTPLGGGKVVSTLKAFFSEPMNPATVTGSFQLFSAGTDGQVGTADDVPVNNGTVAYDTANRSAILAFATPLPDGQYRAVVSPTAMDLSGNSLAAAYVWQFHVADAVFWTRSTDGFWDDPTSWSTGAVPGAADNIVIESIPGDVAVTIRSGTYPFKTLVVAERVVLDGGTLKGGTINQSGAGKLIFTGNAQNTLDGVSVLGDLDLSVKPATAIIRNGLSVSGSIFLKDTGLTFAGNQTFNGHVVLAGFSVLAIQPGSALTLGPAAVVRGKAGVLGGGDFGTRKLINQGLISMDGADPSGLYFRATQFENAGIIECKNGGSITILEGDMRNTGQINATAGATLIFSNGTWHNLGTINANDSTVNLGGTFTPADIGKLNRAGGTITLTGVLDLGGGTLTLDAATGSWRMDGGTFKGGTVKQTSGAKLTFSIGRNTFDGMRVEGDLELKGNAVIRNGLTLSGSVLFDNGSITFSGNQTFNNGQVVFVTSGALSIEPGTTLTLGPDMVVRGKSGTIGGGEFGTRKLINQGLILSDVPGGTLTLSPTSFENPGTLRADGVGASVVVRVTPFTNTGTIQELNSGKVLINP